jgi:tripartite-type tricarboxylate transporter receptor subunit TctC
VVAPSLPIGNLRELIAYAKANPGKLNWGFGLGTSPQLLGELFKHITHTDIAAIPYKGGAQAVTDIMAGQIHMNIGTTATLVPLVHAGKLRAVAVTGDARYPDLADVPTMTESGLPELSLTFWTGLLAPGATPPAVITKLNTTLNDVLRTNTMKQSMAKLGLQPRSVSPQEFAAFLQSEMKQWADAVAVTGVKLD